MKDYRDLHGKFDLGQAVRIGGDIDGHVVAYYVIPGVEKPLVKYEVRYFHNGEVKSVYLHDFEIKAR